MSPARRARFEQRLQRAWLSRGPLAIALWPLACVFGLASALHRAPYRWGWRRTTRLAVPVVVVGNLVAGGAGKTPTVIAIVALLRRLGFVPGVISRGHGRQPEGAGAKVIEVLSGMAATAVGDEPLLIHLRTRAPVVVGRDRVAAGEALLRRHPEVDIVVSDDGLQHLPLARDAQVLVFDERGAGNRWRLPAGPLREALPARVPARTLVLYNAAAASTVLPGGVARRALAGAVSLQAWWAGLPPAPDSLEALAGRPIVAAAGLARPERFFAMLRGCGLSIIPLPLPDHWDFATLPWPPETADVIVTEKDAVKLAPVRAGGTRVWVAALDFTPPPEFDRALAALLGPAPALSPHRNDHGNPPP